jgi:hypothetical protein
VQARDGARWNAIARILARISIWRGKRGMQDHDFSLTSRSLLLRLWSKWIRSSNFSNKPKGVHRLTRGYGRIVHFVVCCGRDEVIYFEARDREKKRVKLGNRILL